MNGREWNEYVNHQDGAYVWVRVSLPVFTPPGWTATEMAWIPASSNLCWSSLAKRMLASLEYPFEKRRTQLVKYFISVSKLLTVTLQISLCAISLTEIVVQRLKRVNFHVWSNENMCNRTELHIPCMIKRAWVGVRVPEANNAPWWSAHQGGSERFSWTERVIPVWEQTERNGWRGSQKPVKRHKHEKGTLDRHRRRYTMIVQLKATGKTHVEYQLGIRIQTQGEWTLTLQRYSLEYPALIPWRQKLPQRLWLPSSCSARQRKVSIVPLIFCLGSWRGW